ncbi:phosphoglycerate kinase [Candidatus Bipolaricaulota bacterium]|nr:phosphoglycerate kinase [Candidatus Bipolaricaulota bacterium]
MVKLLKELRGVQDAPVTGKTVLVRVDYNVPLKRGDITDDARIRASLPTLIHLLDRKAKPVLLTHLGRPEGKTVPELRLEPVAERLQVLLDRPVRKLDDCIGEGVSEAIADGSPGEVILLENVRFHREETANEAPFARALASLGDLYVNDAFATLHRAHASTLGICDHLPSYAGMLIQREVAALSHLTDEPARPYLAIIGGKKARSKLGALRDFLPRVNAVLIGGGVAFTFLAAMGHSVGESMVDRSVFDEITKLLQAADEHGVPIHLPRDVVSAQEMSADTQTEIRPAADLPDGWMGLDIGPETVRLFSEQIENAKTIAWIGPMGAFETEPFSHGTNAIASAVAGSNAFTVVGGGETGEALTKMDHADGISYISTGGGACLAILRGKSLPALEVLRDG